MCRASVAALLSTNRAERAAAREVRYRPSLTYWRSYPFDSHTPSIRCGFRQLLPTPHRSGLSRSSCRDEIGWLSQRREELRKPKNIGVRHLLFVKKPLIQIRKQRRELVVVEKTVHGMLRAPRHIVAAAN